MGFETSPQEPTFNLNEEGKEALSDLKLVLESQKIPNDEQQTFINLLLQKIDGVTDEDLIDMSLANILQLAQKRGKEIKSFAKEVSPENEGSCAKCGARTSSGDNFCGQCGEKIESESACAKCGAKTSSDDNFCGQCGSGLK